MSGCCRTAAGGAAVFLLQVLTWQHRPGSGCDAGTWGLGRGRSEAEDEYSRSLGWWAAALRIQRASCESGAAVGTRCRRLCPGRMAAGGGEWASVFHFQPCPDSSRPEEPVLLPAVFFLFKTQPCAEARCRWLQHATAMPTGSTRTRGTINLSHTPKSWDDGLVV